MRMNKQREIAVALVITAFSLSTARGRDMTLLNVSYDPTREL
jgi:ABC-type sulfate transport system substrate-binding protein